MVQHISTALKQQIAQQLTQVLGHTLSEQEWNVCQQTIECLQPAAGKLFWQATEATAGIYLVLEGKVRLLDSDKNLVISLEAGASLGESTLFPDSPFQSYSARASIGVKLCFIPALSLQSLLRKYPAFQEQIYQRAVLQDFLLLSHQVPVLKNIPAKQVISFLSLLERHSLAVGEIPQMVYQGKQLWFLRYGEMIQTAGQRLTTGTLCTPAWGASTIQATELYSLDAAKWEIALKNIPQLRDLIEPHVTTSDNYQPIEAFPARSTDIILSVAEQPIRKTKLSQAYFPSPTLRTGHWWQRITRRYPFFAQQSAADCGTACLVMIGQYWGKRLNVNRLRDTTNADRNGASLRNLAAAAESIGFSTRPVKASINKLAEQPMPAIAHWEGKHYIVVYEITSKQVVVADPAIGQQTLSHAQFKAGWAGYALLLQPTAFFKETPEIRQPLWQFLALVKPHWLVLLEVFIASIFIQVFGLITPLFTQLLLDRVVVQRSTLTLNAIGIGLLIFGLFRVTMTGLRQYLLDHTASRIDLALIVGFIKHTFRLPLGFFESRYVGDIISRVQENHKIQRFLTGEALSIMLDLLTVFIYVGLMLWYSWKMALLTLVIVPPFVLLALIATPFLQRVSRKIFNANATESSYLIQALTGIHTVKGMAIEHTVGWHWEELFSKSIKTTFSGQVVSNLLQIFSATLETLITTVLLWFGAWQVIQNELTIGQLVAFNMLLGNVINPFRRLTILWNQLQEVLIAVERIQDVIDTEPEENEQHQPRQFLSGLQGHIRFDQVTFRYHADSAVNTLENTSFTVCPGQMVALVGRSGSGKTTISKLILGLYPPTEGKILIDGYDVTSLSLRSLRQQIGVVDQDTFLFGGTIRENISVSHPNATLEDVMAASKQAGAHAFIEALPMGYETQIGEGGGLLSGGQRQRISIARALLGNPRLLILDEATSHLDAESERIIQTNLKTLLQGRTSLVIAHRLSTVRHADLILVLDRGILVESGSHEELMALRGQYFYLNQQQLTLAN
ncbi:MAG: peptidase domain-containing ABC transporter [Oscillatoriophycideae cyanobacterium NC_groundwater_1537_Pr4_S-0.65um_50_18]|nr:peptidase domain-containing ABC transporter [Oscillatoriophycideae cyanobacterium NC_groundwater_1537_Pr4_S-0.65um_50_18]